MSTNVNLGTGMITGQVSHSFEPIAIALEQRFLVIQSKIWCKILVFVQNLPGMTVRVWGYVWNHVLKGKMFKVFTFYFSVYLMG